MILYLLGTMAGITIGAYGWIILRRSEDIRGLPLAVLGYGFYAWCLYKVSVGQ